MEIGTAGGIGDWCAARLANETAYKRVVGICVRVSLNYVVTRGLAVKDNSFGVALVYIVVVSCQIDIVSYRSFL